MQNSKNSLITIKTLTAVFALSLVGSGFAAYPFYLFSYLFALLVGLFFGLRRGLLATAIFAVVIVVSELASFKTNGLAINLLPLSSWIFACVFSIIFSPFLRKRIVCCNMSQSDYLVKNSGGNFEAVVDSEYLQRPIEWEAKGSFEQFNDMKEAAIALRRSEEQLQTIVENLNEGLIVADLEGNLLHWNRAALNMHGFASVLEARKKLDDFSSMFELSDLAGNTLSLDKWPMFRIISGERLEHLVLNIRRLDCSWERVYSYSGHLVVASAGETLAILCVSDITDRYLAENALIEADKKKDDFLAMLAHELRNPMAAISAAANILSRPGIDEEKVKFAREALASRVGQLARLVDDLLDVSRIVRGRIELKNEFLDLRQVVEESVEASRSWYEDRKQRLVVEIEGSLPIFGDRVRLEQIIINVLTNASRYSPPNSRIEVYAFIKDESVIVRVADNGIGIAPDLLERIWDPFTQVTNSLSKEQGGLGVGLAISKRLTEMHKGNISVFSEGEGRGATFEITLPIAESQYSYKDPSSSRISMRSLNILLVEDHADTAMLQASILEEEGHLVKVASDGPSAVDKALAMQPDLILLDIGLPGFDGCEVARRIRKHGLVDVPIIALSGYGQEKDIMRAHEAGIDRHLLKPVNHEALLELLVRYYDLSHTRRKGSK